MVGCGALIPDESLEDFIRDAAGMPERLEDWDDKEDTSASDGGTDANGNQKNSQKPPSSNVSPDDDDLDTEEEDAEDLEKAKKARKRLGRKARR